MLSLFEIQSFFCHQPRRISLPNVLGSAHFSPSPLAPPWVKTSSSVPETVSVAPLRVSLALLLSPSTPRSVNEFKLDRVTFLLKFFTGSQLPQDKITTPQAPHDLAPAPDPRGHVSQPSWLCLVCITHTLTPAHSSSLNLNTISEAGNT